MEKKYYYISCARCNENEAVCKWDLRGEYHGSHICEKCCVELTNEQKTQESKMTFREKATKVNSAKVLALYMLLCAIAIVIIYLRNPNIDYFSIFEYDNLMTFIFLTAYGHIFALLAVYLKTWNKLIDKLYAIIFELLNGLMGVYIILSNKLVFDLKGIFVLISVILGMVGSTMLMIFHKKLQKGKKIQSRILLITFIAFSILMIVFAFLT